MFQMAHLHVIENNCVKSFGNPSTFVEVMIRTNSNARTHARTSIHPRTHKHTPNYHSNNYVSLTATGLDKKNCGNINDCYQLFLLIPYCFQRRCTRGRFYLGNICSPFPKQALVFTCLQYVSFENKLGKGEIARNEQFLLFLHCFLPVWRTFCHFHQLWNCRLPTLSVWKNLKCVVWERVKGLK